MQAESREHVRELLGARASGETLAKELEAERDRGARLGLREDELAFYGAACQNDSAVVQLGDETPRDDRARAGDRRTVMQQAELFVGEVAA